MWVTVSRWITLGLLGSQLACTSDLDSLRSSNSNSETVNTELADSDAGRSPSADSTSPAEPADSGSENQPISPSSSDDAPADGEPPELSPPGDGPSSDVEDHPTPEVPSDNGPPNDEPDDNSFGNDPAGGSVVVDPDPSEPDPGAEPEPGTEQLELMSTNPPSGASGIELHTDILLQFSKPVLVSGGSIAVRRSDDHSLVEDAALSDARVAITSNTLRFDPDAILAPQTSYYVELDADALTAESLEPYAGLSEPEQLSFETTTLGLPDGVSSDGLSLWLDAGHEPSFKLQGDDVVLWADRSGSGHVLRPIGDNPPKRGTTSLNNLPIIEFKESSPLASNGVTLGGINSFDVFVVLRGKEDAGTSNSRVFRWGDAAELNWGRASAAYRHAVVSRVSSGLLASRFDPPETRRGYVWNGTLDTGLHLTASTNGTAGITDSAPGAELVNSTGAFYLGGIEAGELLYGDIGEVLFFTRALDDGERAVLVQHLRSKWNTP